MSVSMSLEAAFARLSVRPSSICRQCRRTFACTPSRPNPPPTATRGLLDSFTSSREAPVRPSIARVSTPTTTTLPSTSSTSSATSDYDLAEGYIKEIDQNKNARSRAAPVRDWDKADLEKQSTRRWAVGDVYAPHDLSGAEAAKWKKLRRKGRTGRNEVDVLDQLNINPIHHYKNFTMMSEYMSDMGRIKHRRITGLRPVNQRRMAKAIRRAIGTGMMPGVHHHPEILRIEQKARTSSGRF